ncbi:hypothetical protein [Guptibacillus algicola]|uniref:hypothetical protein n=1 Tax=Guptibacillus algicola TaxID=225844 RepID=UPI001CD67784|nr:hypothetical protein [Alkalihalobacillus algicola]MCA0986893.1 hypothetical protein [Alkalihalobacillus algicola]
MNGKENEATFREELTKLRQRDFISKSTYDQVSAAYSRLLESEVEQQMDMTQANAVLEEKKAAKTIEKKKAKKVKSTQELRDRNLTWILIIGVVLLLLGGLVLATSTWDVLTSTLKTALIATVSFLFFGISWLSEHKLKIGKTAFAFLVLGSLFLPIIIISAGYFQLFGPWLSISGEGKYVLGLLGTLMCLPLYSYHAIKRNSRLFVWLSFVGLTIGASFFVQLFNPSIDAFFFGIVLFNGLLIIAYVKSRRVTGNHIFIKELPLYLQGNLVLSTILMLFFYDHAVFYSFNIIITSTLYLTMVYVGKQKEYHFVFTLLFIYGIYQLIENSALESLDVFLYSLIGFLFIGLQMLEKFEQLYMKRAFQFTSGIISICAFLFISYKGLLLRFDDPSWLLVAGYVLISINYIYLANLSKMKLFGFLAPLFLLAAGLYPLNLIYDDVNVTIVMLHFFLIGFVLYFLGFYWNKWKFTTVIRSGSMFLSFGPMTLAVLIGIAAEKWILDSVMLGIIGIVFLTLTSKGEREWIREAASVGNPVAWAFAFLVLYPSFAEASFYRDELGAPFHIGATAFMLMGISYVWKDRMSLRGAFFWTAQVAYTIGLLLLLVYPVNALYTRTGLLLGAILFLILLIKKSAEETVWILVSLFTLGAYVSTAAAFPVQGIFQWIPGSIVLIVIGDFITRKSEFVQKSYFYLAHIYLPFALFFTVGEYSNVPILYVAALLIYLYSVVTRTREWEVRAFLYAGFSILPFLYTSLVDFYQFNNAYLYTGFASSVVMVVLWFLLNPKWKDRIKWYVVPFSVLGLVPFTLENTLTALSFSIAICYIGVLLYIMHKSRWQLFSIIPLLFVLICVQLLPFEFIEMTVVLNVLVGTVLLCSGLFIHKQLYAFQSTEVLNNHIDWYSFAALMLVLPLNYYYDASLWAEELPSLFIVILLACQINRVPGGAPKRIVKSLTAVSMLIPYYTLLHHVEINQYLVTEVYVLPWLGVTIYLAKGTWKHEERAVKWIEFGVVAIIAAILVTDAIMSNMIYDALIAGGLSLASILGGFYYRIKSYFLIGISVLILNVFIQTRPYWGNMPWWAYLLISGFTLIGVASFYEWQKQKKDDKGSTILQVKKEQLLRKWKEWK